jgi:hypothetical protein
MMGIDLATSKLLKRPFTANAVKWRADSKKPDNRGRVRCLVYLDASLVRERLDQVDLEWAAEYHDLGSSGSDPLGVKLHVPTECKLVVCGVMRSGVGQTATTQITGSLIKAARSDALKRAALEFGVGAYLRALKTFDVAQGGFWLRQGGPKAGQVGGLTRDGVKALRADYAKMIDHPMLTERFGAAVEYGDLEDDDRSATPEAHPEEPSSTTTAVRPRVQRTEGVIGVSS